MNAAMMMPEFLRSSVIAVPPLARTAGGELSRDANLKIIRHLESGSVATLLYGGNAVLYHAALSEYPKLLALLCELAAAQTLVIASVGPAFGTMMDQADVLRDFSYPTAMILPTRDAATPAGVGRGVRRFVEAAGRPAVLYIKHDGYVDTDTVKGLMDDGLISFIKYAIVREEPSEDAFLRALVDAVGPSHIVSGIGEQPALTHLRDFGLAGFTSGCVCVAPRLSMAMLKALRAGDFETARQIQATFRPLEDLRNAINPIQVLHAAVALAGIAQTGPISPLLSEIDESDSPAVARAAAELLAAEESFSAA